MSCSNYILLILGKPCRRNTCLLSLSVRTWTRRIYKNKKHTMVYAGFWKPFISPDCCWTASFSPVWSLVWCTFCVVGMFYSVVSHLIYKWINNRFRALTEIPRGRITNNYLKCLSGQKPIKLLNLDGAYAAAIVANCRMPQTVWWSRHRRLFTRITARTTVYFIFAHY